MQRWLTSHYRMKSYGEEQFEFHSHPQYEIYYFHRGDCKFLIHHNIYHLKPEDIIIMNGLTAHRANPSRQELYERSVVHFSPKWILPAIEALPMDGLLSPFEEMNNYILRGRDTGERQIILDCIQKIDQITKTENFKPEVESELQVLLITLLIQIFKLSKKENEKLTEQKSEKMLHVEEIAKYIQRNYKHKITLDNLSAEVNLSKFYLSRIFKEVTGTTVMDYVMTCRLNQAKYEVEMSPNKTLQEVARDAGFESPAHFSRLFKERLGMTPSQYRKIYRMGE